MPNVTVVDKPAEGSVILACRARFAAWCGALIHHMLDPGMAALATPPRNRSGNKLFTNTYVIMAMRLLGMFGGFVFWAVAARLVNVDQVGLASGILASAALVARLSQLGFGQVLVRYAPGASDSSRLLNLLLTATAGIAALLAGVFLMGLELWSPALRPVCESPVMIGIFLVTAVSLSLSNLLVWQFVAHRMPIYSLAKNVVQILLSVALVLVLVLAAPDSRSLVFASMLSILISVIVTVRVFVPKVSRNYRFRFVLPVRLHISETAYALSNYVSDILRTLPHNLLPLLMINVLGTTVGAYGFIVWSIALGLDGLANSVAPSFFAEGANNPAMAPTYAKAAVRFSVLMGGGITLVMLAGAPILLYFYGPAYVQNGYLPLVLLTVSIVPSVIVAVYVSLLRIRDRVAELVLVTAFDLVLAMAITYVAMLWLGLLGVGVGWLSSRLVVLAVVGMLWRRQPSLTPSQSDVVSGAVS